MTSSFAKRPIEPRRYVRNGRIPDARFAANLAEDANALSKFRLKELARFATPLDSIPESSSGTRVRFRFAAHLSPHATAIRTVMLLANASTGPTTTHAAEVEITDGSANVLGVASAAFGGTGGGNLPSTMAQASPFVMSSPGAIAQLTGDQPIFGEVRELDGVRIVAISIFEVAYQTPDPVDAGFALGSPILDSDRQAITETLRNAWKQQAAPLITWSVNEDADARVTTSTTATNIVDGTSTTVSAATPGWTLDLSNASTLRRSPNVPCVIKCYASAAVDAGAVLLVDSTGATVATVSIPVGAAAWQSATFNLPASSGKYDLMHKAGTAATTTLYAVSVYPWEA